MKSNIFNVKGVAMFPRLLSSITGLRLCAAPRGPRPVRLGCRGAGSNSRVFAGGTASPRGPPFQGTDTADQYEEDPDGSDLAERLEDAFRKEQKRQKTIRFHRARRQMTPPGPPPRTLTWEAIQQIRYLKQELPEEWTLERLAKGFSVSPDVIARVLRGSFMPPAERRRRQDTRVAAAPGQGPLVPALQAGRGHIRLPGGAKALLGPGPGGNSLAPVTALVPRPSEGIASNCTPAPPPPRRPLPRLENAALGTQQEDDGDEADRWDGTVLSDRQLEELAEQHRALPRPDSAIIRKGREVFDSQGNFLYRI
ncbi:neugrin-like [Arapaima gigas]